MPNQKLNAMSTKVEFYVNAKWFALIFCYNYWEVSKKRKEKVSQKAGGS